MPIDSGQKHRISSLPPRLYVLASLLVVGVTMPAGVARAHPESISNLRMSLDRKGLHTVMTLPTRDLTRWFPPGRYPNYVADVVRELQAQADSLLEVHWDDQLAHPSAARVRPGLTGYIIAELDYAIPDGAAALAVRPACITNLPNDHQQLTTLEDDRSTTPGGRVLADQALNAQQDTLSVDLPDVAIAVSAEAPSPQASLATVAPSPPGRAVPRNRAWRVGVGCCLLIVAVFSLWVLPRVFSSKSSPEGASR